jgi:hypothetical protein
MTDRLALAVLLTAVASIARADTPRAPPAASAGADEDRACAACHEKRQPAIVSDWRLSKHARQGIGCSACHGRNHTSEADRELAELPTVDTCQRCHEKQKAKALKRVGANHGRASCDACHTRHLFSKLEARQPEACRTCHDSLHYDAWASSKHGTRHMLEASGRLPAEVAAPTCQDCHMQEGDHANRTPWGNWPAPAAPRGSGLGRRPGGHPRRARRARRVGRGYGPRYTAMHETGMIHLDREASIRTGC